MLSLLRRLLPKAPKDKIEENVCNVDLYDKSYALPLKLLRWSSIMLKHNKPVRYNLSISSDDCIHRQHLSNIYYQLYAWFAMLNLVIFGPCEFIGLLTTVLEAKSLEDYDKVLNIVPCCLCTVLSFFKYSTMVYNRPVFEKIMDELRTMWPRRPVSESEHKIIHRSLKQLKYVVKGYFWSNNVQLMSFLAPPFFIILARYMGYDSPMVLPFVYWLPFDPMRPVYYEFMLVLQTWQMLVVIWWSIAWDILFCTLICHITTQFDLLALRMERLFGIKEDHKPTGSYASTDNCKDTEVATDPCSLDNEHVWEIKQQIELADIVLRHCAVIRISNDLESVCSLTLLVNFIIGSISICFCGFCSLFVEAWSDLAYKSFLLNSLSQTWLLCWYGQKLIDSSIAISDAVYNCKWYKMSRKFKNQVLIILHRAQNGVHVTMYGFSVVSLESFTTIVKTSWSYFSLISNFYKK